MNKINQTKNYKGIQESPLPLKGAGCEADWGFLKNNKGITIITLVITIVLMLILASITINIAINGGLFENAGNAKTNMEIASEKETIQKASMIAESTSKTGRVTVDQMQKTINKVANENIATAYDNDETIIVKITKSNRYYEIDSKGHVTGPIEMVFDTEPGVLDGTGTADDPFVIMSIEDLVYFSKQVNEGKNYSGEYVELGKTLDFKSELSYIDVNTTEYDEYLGGDGTTGLKEQLTNGLGFTPIGGTKTFSGKFEGNNKKIKNLYINNTTLTNVGLFGYVSAAEIKNLEVIGKITSSKDSAKIGGVIGNISVNSVAVVDSCCSKVEIKDTATAGGWIGGIVGYSTTSKTSISNCGNEGKIVSESATVAGIINYSVGTIKDCYNNADLTTTNGNCAGIMGYANYNAFKIENCTNTGTIISEKKAAGGIGGYLIASGTASITNCINEGEVKGYSCVGGIAGKQDVGSIVIQDCYNIGTIICENNQAGGIGGILKSANVINCYNTGKINGGQQIGGLVGMTGYMSPVTLTNCWNTGDITGNTHCGGFSGVINLGSLTLNNCYNIGSVTGKTKSCISGIAGMCGNGTGGTVTIYNTFIINKDEKAWTHLISHGPGLTISNNNNFYYRKTTFNAIGTATTNGTPIECTDANMKTQAFVDELNSNIETGWSYEQENEDETTGTVTTETVTIDTTGWAKWVYNKDGYPTLDLSTTWNGTEWVKE